MFQAEEDSTIQIEVVEAVVVEAEQMADEVVLVAEVGIEEEEEDVVVVAEEGDNKARRAWTKPGASRGLHVRIDNVSESVIKWGSS